MQYPVITCVNAVYAAIWSDKTMVFTQDSEEAKEVGEELGLYGEPNWWDQYIEVDDENIEDVTKLFSEMYTMFGKGMCEFICIYRQNRMTPQVGDTIVISGFTVD